MDSALPLLPVPRSLRATGTPFALPAAFALDVEDASLRKMAEISAALAGKVCGVGVNSGAPWRVKVRGEAALAGEAYELTVTETGAVVAAGTPEGVSRAFASLAQILLAGPRAVEIADEPAFSRRGYMLDISRDRVPARRTLAHLLDLLWLGKVNELQLYVEHTFAFAGHEEVWKDASPLHSSDIRWLEDQCAARGIELVPNLNSLGHFGRWLCHPSYRRYSECPEGCVMPSVRVFPPGGTTLYPCPETLNFLGDLYDQYLPLFSSRRFSGGLDEPWELGMGRSRAECEKRGKHAVYLAHLSAVAKLAAAHGKTLEFWADIVLEKPESVPQLPEGITGMIWGYEKGHPFESHCAAFEKAGVPFVACPGTTGWNSLGGRWENARANIAEAVRAAREHGGTGLLLTDWGDNGHHQPLPVTLPPLFYFASKAWNSDAEPDVAAGIDLVLGDSSKTAGKLLVELGSAAERHFALRLHNTSPAWKLFFSPNKDLPGILPPEDAANLTAFREEMVRIAGACKELRAVRLGGKLVAEEIALAARMMDYGAFRAQKALGQPAASADTIAILADDYEALWLKRSERGGLAESLARVTAVD
jgi:hypothetical protein